MVNKKLILSLLTLGIVTSIAAAGTWAVFSDSKETKDNQVSAGTLTLSATEPDRTTAVASYTFTNIYPGWGYDSSHDRVVVLRNTGSLKGDVGLRIKNIVSTTPTGKSDLASKLKVVIYQAPPNTGSGVLVLDGKTIQELATLSATSPVSLQTTLDESTGTNPEQSFVVRFYLPIDTGDEVQGSSTKFDVEYDLTQHI